MAYLYTIGVPETQDGYIVLQGADGKKYSTMPAWMAGQYGYQPIPDDAQIAFGDGSGQWTVNLPGNAGKLLIDSQGNTLGQYGWPADNGGFWSDQVKPFLQGAAEFAPYAGAMVGAIYGAQALAGLAGDLGVAVPAAAGEGPLQYAAAAGPVTDAPVYDTLASGGNLGSGLTLGGMANAPGMNGAAGLTIPAGTSVGSGLPATTATIGAGSALSLPTIGQVLPAAATASLAGRVGDLIKTNSGTLIPAGAIVGSSVIGANAANKAAGIQAGAAENAAALNNQAAQASIDEQRRQFDLTRSDLASYREAGTSALGTLKSLLDSGDLTRKFTLDDFWSDPVTKASYQSGLDLGMQAINNMARSRGSLNSGATIKALSRFGTDYTGGQAAGSQARFMDQQNQTFNKYANVAGIGQQATNTGASLGANTAANIGATGVANANTVGNLYTGAANARGAAAIGGANAISGAGNTLANWYLGQQTLDKILNQQRPTTVNYYGS